MTFSMGGCDLFYGRMRLVLWEDVSCCMEGVICSLEGCGQ